MKTKGRIKKYDETEQGTVNFPIKFGIVIEVEEISDSAIVDLHHKMREGLLQEIEILDIEGTKRVKKEEKEAAKKKQSESRLDELAEKLKRRKQEKEVVADGANII
jgi:hypothetical protein